MEFTNEFTIPVPPDDAFAVLTDLEKVAPCFPGAVLEEVEGDTYRGRVKVKLGPMSLTYAGEATVVGGEDRRSARIDARGREKRGSGTAAADVTATLAPDGEGTRVTVTTDLKVTGKPAQFGRGVMGEVGAKIIDQFADCLRDELGGAPDADAPDAADAAGAGDDTEGAGATRASTNGDGAAARAASRSAATGSDATPAGHGAAPSAQVVEAATASATTPPTVAPHATPGSARADVGAGGADDVTGTADAGGAGTGSATGVRTVDVRAHQDALDLVEVAGGATAKRLAPLALLVAAAAALAWWLRR